VAVAEIADFLVRRYSMAEDRAEEIARASGGSPGWAILAAEQPELLERRQTRARELLHLLDADRLDRLRAADALAERWTAHQDDVRDVLETWADVWRDALFVQEGLSDYVKFPNLWVDIEKVAPRLAPAIVRGALEFTLDVADSLARNAHPRLALETYTLLLPRLASVRG
jgi:hypothetical protein